MINLLKQISHFTLVASLAIPQAALAQQAAVDSSAFRQAALARQAARSPLQRLGLTSTNFKSKAAQATKLSGQFVNEVVQFQALVIMLSVAQSEMIKQRAKQQQFSKSLGIQNAPADSPISDSADLCAQRSGSAAATDMLCSGDFLIGMAAGAGLLATNMTAQRILKLVVSSKPHRSALFTVMTAMASTSLLVVGGVASSMLWTEAIRLLPDEEQMKQAQTVAGRAAVAYASGQGQKFSQSKDGVLFWSIMDKMYNILLVDDELRSLWISNVFRFGLRGELLTAIPILMSASSLGQAGAGLMIAEGGLSAPMISFVLGSIIGYVALSELMESNVVPDINKKIQNLRLASQEYFLERNLQSVRLSLIRFKVGIHQNTEQYNDSYFKLLDSQLNEREIIRNRAATTIVEKFYELRLSVEKLKQDLKILAATTSKELQKQIVVNVDGSLVKLEEALSQNCGSQKPLCKLQELQQAFIQAETASAEAGQHLAEVYKKDSCLFSQMASTSNYIYPIQVSSRLSEEISRNKMMFLNFQVLFTHLSPMLEKTWPGIANSSQESKEFRKQAALDLSEYYQLTVDEKKISQALGPLINEPQIECQ